MDYREAGVDVEAGRDFVEQIRRGVESTYRPGVLGGLGGFGGLFQLPSGYREPVLVSGTDGVGTKLKIAQALNRHNTIGIDLVAMCTTYQHIVDHMVGVPKPYVCRLQLPTSNCMAPLAPRGTRRTWGLHAQRTLRLTEAMGLRLVERRQLVASGTMVLLLTPAATGKAEADIRPEKGWRVP